MLMPPTTTVPRRAVLSPDVMAANCLALLRAQGLAADHTKHDWSEIFTEAWVHGQIRCQLVTRRDVLKLASVCKAWRFRILAWLSLLQTLRPSPRAFVTTSLPPCSTPGLRCMDLAVTRALMSCDPDDEVLDVHSTYKLMDVVEDAWKHAHTSGRSAAGTLRDKPTDVEDAEAPRIPPDCVSTFAELRAELQIWALKVERRSEDLDWKRCPKCSQWQRPAQVAVDGNHGDPDAPCKHETEDRFIFQVKNPRAAHGIWEGMEAAGKLRGLLHACLHGIRLHDSSW